MPRPEPPSQGETPARDPRREILAAASALLDEGGAEGLTIRRLALRCGYTAPAIYAEFGDKAGLLDAVLRDAIDDLIERVEQPAQALRAVRADARSSSRRSCASGASTPRTTGSWRR